MAPTPDAKTVMSTSRRSEDQAWFSAMRPYEAVILLGIVVVMMISSVFAWIDRRDNVEVFKQLNLSIAGLSAQAASTNAVLTRVETRSEMLATQNARWVSLERELAQLRDTTKESSKALADLTVVVQRNVDWREREQRGQSTR